MGWSRFGAYWQRIQHELHTAFAEVHTPREIAGSFALGTFVTMLPTLGVGLLLFVVLASVSSWVSKLALFASVLVFNPIVKWGVYVISFLLGVLILGPVEGVSLTDISFTAAPEIVIRLLVGNIILALVATICSYFAVLWLTHRYRGSQVVEVFDDVVDEIVDNQ